MKEHVILYKNMLHTSLLCTSMLYVQEHVTHELVMHEHVICTVQERDKLDFFILNIFFVLK